MVPLDSPRWATLRSSSGFNGELAARLLREIRAGTGEDWAELYHQACHGFNIHGDLAYAVVPHVVDIASRLPVRERIWPLVIAGTVAACRMAFPSSSPPVPDDLRAEYEASAQPALQMATVALSETGWRRGAVVELLGVVAAFQGHCDLAMQLFLHGGSDHDLSCPECGQYIRWREEAEG
jgi:hypothetical protein